MPDTNYTRHYIAYSGRTILGAGKTQASARRDATKRGARPGTDINVAFAAKAVVDTFRDKGNAKFVIAVNGRAVVPSAARA